MTKVETLNVRTESGLRSQNKLCKQKDPLHFILMQCCTLNEMLKLLKNAKTEQLKLKDAENKLKAAKY